VSNILLKDTINLEGTTFEVGYTKDECAPYFTGDIQKVEDEAFEKLLGQPIPPTNWEKNQPLHLNDSISQLYYAESPIGRFVYKTLTRLLDRSIKKGKPNLNLYFNYNMTFRAMSKMTGGLMNRR